MEIIWYFILIKRCKQTYSTFTRFLLPSLHY